MTGPQTLLLGENGCPECPSVLLGAFPKWMGPRTEPGYEFCALEGRFRLKFQCNCIL